MKKAVPEYRRCAAGGDPPAPATVSLSSRVRLRAMAWRSPPTESRPRQQALIWSSCISLSFALRISASDNQTRGRLRIFPITGIEGCLTQCEVRRSRAHANVWSLKEGKRHASAVAMMDQSIERESAFDPVSKGQRCLRRLEPFGRSLHDVVITAIDGRNIP
jgi:hypothetical protein